MPSTSASTTSPGLRNSGGVRENPTPLGVPVAFLGIYGQLNGHFAHTPKFLKPGDVVEAEVEALD